MHVLSPGDWAVYHSAMQHDHPYRVGQMIGHDISVMPITSVHFSCRVADQQDAHRCMQLLVERLALRISEADTVSLYLHHDNQVGRTFYNSLLRFAEVKLLTRTIEGEFVNVMSS